jgi:hypothetical protein
VTTLPDECQLVKKPALRDVIGICGFRCCVLLMTTLKESASCQLIAALGITVPVIHRERIQPPPAHIW